MTQDLYQCYDTRQKVGDFTGGLRRLLSAWHLRGRYPDRSGRTTTSRGDKAAAFLPNAFSPCYACLLTFALPPLAG